MKNQQTLFDSTDNPVYFNSTGLKGKELKAATSKAKAQDDVILECFKTFEHLKLTPERCLRHLRIMEQPNENRWANTPLTSLRRSFSNLKNRGLIEKTDVMIMGDYGKRVNLWRLCK